MVYTIEVNKNRITYGTENYRNTLKFKYLLSYCLVIF